MKHLESVAVLDGQRSHWVVKGPADTSVEWDAEIIEDIPNERISWRSLSNSQVDNAGSVEFVAGDRPEQTEVKVVMTYNPALGAVGDAFAHWFGESPDIQLADDLMDFKKAMEGGK